MALPSRKSIGSRLRFAQRRTSSATAIAVGGTAAADMDFRKTIGASGASGPMDVAATMSGLSPQRSETSTIPASPFRENPRDMHGSGSSSGGHRIGFGGSSDATTAAAPSGTEAQVRVIFGEGELRSTSGKPLGLTISPAEEGSWEGTTGTTAIGVRIDELSGGQQAVGVQEQLQAQALLRPGDLVVDVDGRDVRRLPFSDVLRLLDTQTPHAITTAPGDGNGSNSGSNNSRSSRISSHSVKSSGHPYPFLPGNATKKLRGSLTAAPVGPRTPGSGNKTASPSTTRSLAPTLSIPPSPGALPFSSPTDRLGSPLAMCSKDERSLPPPLTESRHGSWRRNFSSKWGGGRKYGSASSAAPTTSVAFFSSPAATPPKSAFSSFKRAASLRSRAGDTPGGKPSRMSRTRSMLTSTFRLLSPRVARGASPRAAATPSMPRLSSPPRTPCGAVPAPPSPAGEDTPCEDMRALAQSGPTPSTESTSGRAMGVSRAPPDRHPHDRGSRASDTAGAGAGAGAAAGSSRRRAARRESNLRFSIDVSRDDDCGLIDQEDHGGHDDEGQNDKEDRSARKIPGKMSSVSSSTAFESSYRQSQQERGDTRCAEDENQMEEEQQAEDSLRWTGTETSRESVKGKPVTSSTDGGHSDDREHQGVGEVPVRERDEEEIIALSSYLACTGRGWPWAGNDILWAEYVSLNGHHRWIRSERCRHALLVVREALYLLELPTAAVNRARKHGMSTRARGSWYVKVNASDLSHVSVPVPLPFPPTGQGRRVAAGKTRGSGEERSETIEAGSGLVFHKQGKDGAYAWLECRNSASRNALVNLVTDWEKAEGGRRSPLKVELTSVAQLSADFGGQRQGRKVPTLIDERQACPLW